MVDLDGLPPPETVDSFMCDDDVIYCLDELIADLEEEEPCSLENTVDVEN